MSQDAQKTLKGVYNAFDPLRPLDAGDPVYVDCSAVRGEEDILEKLGRRITLSDKLTCQLYSGHRGNGKSTELLKLKDSLEKQGYRVVYFAADEQDIESEDAQYTDVLLACARHLLREFKGDSNNPIWRWMQSRLGELSNFLQREISLENLGVEAQLTQFAKIMATLKASPAVPRLEKKYVSSSNHTQSP